MLPAIAFSAHRAQPRLLPFDSGTGSLALPVRGGGICRHAGTHPLARHRTCFWNPVYGNAGLEAAHGPRSVAEEEADGCTAESSVCRRDCAYALLAGALLRLQRVDDEEARGKAEVHTSQSGEAGIGEFARGMALEQF